MRFVVLRAARHSGGMILGQESFFLGSLSPLSSAVIFFEIAVQPVFVALSRIDYMLPEFRGVE